MMPGQYPTRARIWVLAALLALIVHVGAVIGVASLRVFAATPVEVPEDDVVDVVFVDAPAPADEPSWFTELPPDRTDDPPDHPDFLSNVTSRARDDIPGGVDGSLPGQEGRSEAPHIALTPGLEPPAPSPADAIEPAAVDASASATPNPDGTAATEATAGKTADETGERADPESPAVAPETPTASASLAPPDPRARAGAAPTSLGPRSPGSAPDLDRSRARATGNSDVFQEAMSAPDRNAGGPLGSVSLNTTAWAYGEWMRQFRRDFEKQWVAPYGYRLGWIDGWTTLEMEIAPSGELVRWEVLEERGHKALREASIGAMLATAPFRPLPDDFPEESLILRIRLIYPPH